MSLKVVFAAILILSILSVLRAEETEDSSNLYPVIGIVSLPTGATTGFNPQDYSFFASSYVGFLQMAGARVAVIPWDAPNITDYLAAVNGVLLTGGSINLTYANGTLQPYGVVLQNVVNFVYQINQERYYPMWGTCQGFQALSIIISKNGTIMTPCQGWCIYVGSTNFLIQEGRMFKDMSTELKTKLSTNNLTTFDHSWQIDYQSYLVNPNLKDNMNILTYSLDGAGTKFISSFEHKTLPIYGTQFHPEKAPFEWKQPGIVHCYDCVRVAQHLSNFFVGEVRKSTYAFDDAQNGWILTYNYPAYAIPTSAFNSIYVFKNTDFSAQGMMSVNDMESSYSEI